MISGSREGRGNLPAGWAGVGRGAAEGDVIWGRAWARWGDGRKMEKEDAPVAWVWIVYSNAMSSSPREGGLGERNLFPASRWTLLSARTVV